MFCRLIASLILITALLPSISATASNGDDDSVYLECPSGLKLVRSGSAYLKILKPDGSLASEDIFDQKYYNAKQDCGGPLIIKHRAKYGFVTQEGKIIKSPLSFDDVRNFALGYATVKINGLWGIINLDGDLVVTPKYEKSRPHFNTFNVVENGRQFWITPQGKETHPPPKPDDTYARLLLLQCKGGHRKFSINGKWGIASNDDTILIAPDYRAVSCLVSDMAWIPVDDIQMWCPVDLSGENRPLPDCRQKHYEFNPSESHPERFAAEPYESSVLWNKKLLEYGIGIANDPPYYFFDLDHSKEIHVFSFARAILKGLMEQR